MRDDAIVREFEGGPKAQFIQAVSAALMEWMCQMPWSDTVNRWEVNLAIEARKASGTKPRRILTVIKTAAIGDFQMVVLPKDE